ncbi:hypothetical protein LR48_Vigan08g133000 [Vigna angularis]|uniref:Uncharacterized protein n=1 Tax=Phaseolus angularis TaxID=3914 RepID=A0A0L9V690_PHAAN|nr:hypothetical protein LR48_Vigan08g133000 [Vigna angularis]
MPSTVQERSSQESGRSPRRQKSGRSSRVEARADARPGAGGRRSFEPISFRFRAVWKLLSVKGRRTLVVKPYSASVNVRSRLECKNARPRRADARPEGRRADARPGAGGRSSQIEDARPVKRTFVQGRRTLVPGQWTFVQAGGRSSQKRALVQERGTFVQRRGRSSQAEGARPERSSRKEDARPD